MQTSQMVSATNGSQRARFALMVALHREMVGQRIAARRLEIGLSQETLGDRVGVRARTISRWETGGSLGRIENLERVASALETSVADLMTPITEADGKPTDLNISPVEVLRDQLSRIEGKLDELLSAQAAERVKQAVADAAQESRDKRSAARQAPRAKGKRAGDGKGGGA